MDHGDRVLRVFPSPGRIRLTVFHADGYGDFDVCNEDEIYALKTAVVTALAVPGGYFEQAEALLREAALEIESLTQVDHWGDDTVRAARKTTAGIAEFLDKFGTKDKR